MSKLQVRRTDYLLHPRCTICLWIYSLVELCARLISRPGKPTDNALIDTLNGKIPCGAPAFTGGAQPLSSRSIFVENYNWADALKTIYNPLIKCFFIIVRFVSRSSISRSAIFCRISFISLSTWSTTRLTDAPFLDPPLAFLGRCGFRSAGRQACRY